MSDPQPSGGLQYFLLEPTNFFMNSIEEGEIVHKPSLPSLLGFLEVASFLQFMVPPLEPAADFPRRGPGICSHHDFITSFASIARAIINAHESLVKHERAIEAG